MDLAEFLLARIAEDEAFVTSGPMSGQLLGAWAAAPRMWWEGGVLTIAAARVLAECEAKRRIVALYLGRAGWDGTSVATINHSYARGWHVATTEALKALALPFADHADFLPEWLPEETQ